MNVLLEKTVALGTSPVDGMIIVTNYEVIENSELGVFC